MPKYIIEREIPGAGNLGTEELKGISQKSMEVLDGMRGTVQWVHSYVTDDKIYCVYISPDVEKIKQHAEKGEFPVDKVFKVSSIIDPITAEG